MYGEDGDGEQSSDGVKWLLKLADVFEISPEVLLTEDVNEESVPALIPGRNKKVLPNMAYWGGVADNARNVAKYGNDEDMADVTQMLRRALAYFGAVSSKPAVTA